MPRIPQTITNPPMAKKNTGYPPIASIIPPKAITTTIATTGNMASTLSAVALFFGVVMSVIHALKAESLLVEPKKVITQSITITVTAVAVITL